MKPNRSIPAATVIPVLTYPDVRAAVIVADTGSNRRSPRPDAISHSVMVRVENVDAHLERARRHGARVVMEPKNFEYGERQYAVEDLAGHQWSFSETLADVAPEEWGGISVG